MELEKIYLYGRRELEEFFGKDEISKEDTLRDLRYFLIKDAYAGKEFPLYQQEIIDEVGVKNFKNYDDLYDVLLNSNIVFRLSSLFDFSPSFMSFLLQMPEEKDIYYLRYKLGQYLYEDKMIEGDYFTSPCYKINMLNSDSYEEAKEIFFSYESGFQVQNSYLLSRVYKKLSFKKYKEEEKDLNAYLFKKYNDKFIENLEKIKSVLNSYITSILDLNVNVRKSVLHYLFEESKNPLYLSLKHITYNSDIFSLFFTNLPFIKRLEDFVPYRLSYDSEIIVSLYLKIPIMDEVLPLIAQKDENKTTYFIDVDIKLTDKNKLEVEERLKKFVTYGKIVKKDQKFVYKYLTRVPNLEEFLIQFTLTFSSLKINKRYKRDLIVMSLFKFFFLSQENWTFFIENYRFELLDENMKDIIFDNFTLDKKDKYNIDYTMRLVKICLMVQHLDIVIFPYLQTHSYILDNLLSQIPILFPQYQNLNLNNDIYKIGINVHSANRDKKTLEGVNLLFSSQGKLSKSEVEEYFSDFISYAEKNLTENEIKVLNHILGIDINTGEKLEKRQKGDFGGLFSHKLMLGGNVFDPKELIARFFLFAETYEEDCNDTEEKCEEIKNKERENLKHGTLRGLISSLQQDNENEQRMNAEAYGENKENHIVCNPGKVQRLVAATLSGRLKDEKGKVFNIEDKEIKEEKENKENNKVSNLDEIHQYLLPFVNLYMYEKETRVRSAKEFFTFLYDYVWHLSQGDIAKFGKVKLNMSFVVYYCIFMAMKGNTLYIAPSLSLVSQFDDMFDITYYINKFGKQEEEAWKKAHPEEVKMLEKGREGREKMLNKVEEVRENQRIRRELAERYGRSPTQDEIRRERDKR
jgi:hypothetical protein